MRTILNIRLKTALLLCQLLTVVLMASQRNEMPARPVIQIKPQDGGQTFFLQRTEFEVLFGGAAGPGKSWALVIDALGLQFKGTELKRCAYQVPGYRAVLFRRKTTELGLLIDQAKKYYGRFGGRFTLTRPGDPGPCFEFKTYDENGKLKKNEPAKIFFCHMQYEGNKEDHQGKEYQYVGFDELTQFTATQYLYLFSRCRNTISPHLFPRVRSTTNPVGTGLVWVRKRFPIESPYRTKYYLPPEDLKQDPKGLEVASGTPKSLSRAFIPGYLAENKILQENDPDYATRIMAMGKIYEKALLHNDWWAFSGDFFKMFDRTKEVIKPFAIPEEWYLGGAVDPGYSSPCAFGLDARDLEGNIYTIAHYYESERNAHQNATGVKQFIENCKWTKGRMPRMIVSGHDAWAKKDRLAIVANDVTFADAFRAKGLMLQRAMIDRHQGWWNWKSLMPNKWFVFAGLNNPLLDEMSAAVADENDPEDIVGKGNDPNISDHALDRTRYSVAALFKPKTGPTPPSKETWQQRLARKAKNGEKWEPGMG